MQDNTNESCNEYNRFFFRLKGNNTYSLYLVFLVKLFTKSPNSDHTLKRVRFHIEMTSTLTANGIFIYI